MSDAMDVVRPRLVDDWTESECQEAIEVEKVKAKAALVEFLVGKGVSKEVATTEYTVLTRISNKGKDSTTAKFTNHFLSSAGLSLPSKYDVLSDAQRRDLQNVKDASTGFGTFDRQSAHIEKKAELEALEGKYPVDLAGIRVHNFGKIKVETSGSPEFHNPVQIYPVGYKAEIEFASIRSLEPTYQAFFVEVVEKDGGPEFTITNASNGQLHYAATEAMVFKKLEAISGYGTIGTHDLSFFNIDVERLIEGMDGVLELPEYRFHEERGYGASYFTQAENLETKLSILAKDSRERRNRRRDALRFMSPEEQKRINDLENRRAAEEKETEKLDALAEKQRKLKEKEADKLRNDASKAAVKAKKEEEKKKLEEVRLKKKEEEKALRDKQKADEKYRGTYRRTMKNEAKKKRTEAIMKVLDKFDKEEGGPDSDDEGAESSRVGGTYLNRAIEALPSCSRVFMCGKDADYVDWNHAIEVANALYLHKDLLNLQFPCTLEHLLSNLCAISPTPKKESSSSGGGSGVVKEEGKSQPKVKNHNKHISLDNIIDDTIRIPSGSQIQAEAELDRTQLCLIKAMVDQIHSLLDLDGVSGENLPEDSRSAARVAFRLPLNQLTWQEIARMCLISLAFKELRGDNANSKTDFLFAMKGNRGSPYRANKNVVRHIRYRWHCRQMLEQMKRIKGNKKALAELAAGFEIPDYVRNHATIDPRSMSDSILSNNQYPLASTFGTEVVLMDQLSDVATDKEYSDAYQRMAVILLKLLVLGCAKNFIWDLDSEYMESYFESIKRPVSLGNVAMHIINRSYDDVENASEEKTMRDFYLEVMTVFNNCYAFNTEMQPLVGHAHRAAAAFRRHFLHWMLDPDRPDVSKCTEAYCFKSGNLIQRYASIWCGRCAAVFCLDGLTAAYNKGDFWVVPVTSELCNSTLVEWSCPYCLKEDSVLNSKLSGGKEELPPCFVDDTGPSMFIPWQFNAAYSSEAESLIQDSPVLKTCLDALSILNDPRKTGIIEKGKKSSAVDGTDALLRGDETESDTEQNESRGARHGRVGAPSLWTTQERLTIMLALCNYMRTLDPSVNRIESMKTECEKLRTIASQGTFKEGEFMRSVNTLCGDQGTAICRAMLDGISGAVAGAGIRREVKARVFEGRCSVCKVSTYEEDCDEGEEVGEVLLCEGCNAETHLRCTSHTSIPKDEYFCSECQERNNARAGASGNPAMKFNNLNPYRSQQVEEEITNRKIDWQAALDGHKAIDDPVDADTSKLVCNYCGYSEEDVCSPIVVGQTRAEHLLFVQQNCRDRAETNTGLKVSFRVDSQIVSAPGMVPPYYPLLSSWNGDDLLEHALHLKAVADESDLYVHEICALEMFRARLGTLRHTARRKRIKVANLAINMAGAITRPLGVDDEGRQYWRFACSNGLFVCYGPNGNEDEVNFNQSIARFRDKEGLTGAKLITAGSNPVRKLQKGSHQLWKVVVGNADVRSFANSLGNSKNERVLRRNVRAAFSELEEETRKAATSASDAPANSTATAVKVEANTDAATAGALTHANLSERQKVVEDVKAKLQADQIHAQKKAEIGESTPVCMELAANKGAQIDRYCVIQSETVFDESVPSEALDGEDGDASSEYLYFSRKFHAVGLCNLDGKHIKPQKGVYTVTYQIHRDGSSEPLVCSKLTDPWTDGFYFFSSVRFKRSGDYTISFLVEGANAPNIEPLVFPVTVQSKMTVCGPADALDRLLARDYMNTPGRRVLGPKLSMSALTAQTTRSRDELTACKAVLLAIFIALPQGALQLEGEAREDGGGRKQKLSKAEPRDENITETSGWNDDLEKMWCDTVSYAQSSAELMEACVCLEYYLHRKWISEFGTKLLNALPPPHYAVRAPTLSAVAMRVYCLDKVLLYDKVKEEERSTRSTEKGSVNKRDKAESVGAEDEEEYFDNAGRSHRKRTRVNYAEVAGEDAYEEQIKKATSASLQAKAKKDAEEAARAAERVDVVNLDFEEEMEGCGRAPYSEVNDHKLRCLSILRALYTEEAMVFWEPVPHNLTDYFEMIANPMDLGSILGMIRKAQLTDCATFGEYVRLVWSNCMHYNAEGTPLHNLAAELSKMFETMFEQMVVNDDKPKDPIQTFDSYGNISGSDEAIRMAREEVNRDFAEEALKKEALAREKGAAAAQEGGDKMDLEA